MGFITAISDRTFIASSVERIASQLSLPPHFLRILFAVEDKRYLMHHGVDLIAVMRAMLANLVAGAWVQGGSTITQQLARLNEPEPGWPTTRSMRVKVRHAWRAIRYERKASKAAILGSYLNSAYFGNGYNGLRAASLGYFNVSPERLTEAQSFFLADRLALPSSVIVSRLVELLARRPLAIVLRQSGIDDLIAIYDEKFKCGGEIWQALAKSPRKSAAPTLSY